jgi:hypothetical protein
MQERPRASKVKRDAEIHAIGNLLSVAWPEATGVSEAPVIFAPICIN